MPKRFVNKKAYSQGYRKPITLTVEVMLDGVPGGFNQLEDHINFIFDLPYVLAIEVDDKDAHRIHRSN